MEEGTCTRRPGVQKLILTGDKPAQGRGFATGEGGAGELRASARARNARQGSKRAWRPVFLELRLGGPRAARSRIASPPGSACSLTVVGPAAGGRGAAASFGRGIAGRRLEPRCCELIPSSSGVRRGMPAFRAAHETRAARPIPRRDHGLTAGERPFQDRLPRRAPPAKARRTTVRPSAR